MKMRFLLLIAVLVIAASPAQARKHHLRYHHATQAVLTHGEASQGETIIGGRPTGCPHAYCGCGARLYLGLTDVRLNLASNWLRYYTGTTLIAVWSHHVAIIERMTGPRTAILRDYNSGHGLSRIHERSLVGARIIGHGGRIALQ